MTDLHQAPAPETEPADGGASTDPRRWLALAVIAVAQLMVVLDASIVTIALPSAQHSLHISTANRQWVVTAYTLTFGGLLFWGGGSPTSGAASGCSSSVCSGSQRLRPSAVWPRTRPCSSGPVPSRAPSPP